MGFLMLEKYNTSAITESHNLKMRDVMSDLKTGDVVELKSGGPAMTVSGTNDAGIVECTWFDSKKILNKEVFDQDILQPHKKVVPKPYSGSV